MLHQVEILDGYPASFSINKQNTKKETKNFKKSNKSHDTRMVYYKTVIEILSLCKFTHVTGKNIAEPQIYSRVSTSLPWRQIRRAFLMLKAVILSTVLLMLENFDGINHIKITLVFLCAWRNLIE